MVNLLDTSAILAHYRNEAGAGRVQELFADDAEEILIASVSLPEFARRLLELGMDDAEILRVVADYRQVAGAVVAVDAAVAETSWEVICQTPKRLPLVDALIASAALVNGARLVHRDAHMCAIPASLLAQLDLEDIRV